MWNSYGLKKLSGGILVSTLSPPALRTTRDDCRKSPRATKVKEEAQLPFTRRPQAAVRWPNTGIATM